MRRSRASSSCYLQALRGELALLADQLVALRDHNVHVITQAPDLEQAWTIGARLVRVTGLHVKLALPFTQLQASASKHTR